MVALQIKGRLDSQRVGAVTVWLIGVPGRALQVVVVCLDNAISSALCQIIKVLAAVFFGAADGSIDDRQKACARGHDELPRLKLSRPTRCCADTKLAMNISSFDDLLQAARQQPDPQQLLFVFVSADLPADSTPQQRESFLAGQGGALVPVMALDRSLQALRSFAELVEESRQFGHDWRLVFAAALSGSGGVAPAPQAVEKQLQRMIEAIKAGTLGPYIPFDRQGHAVRLAH